MTLLEAVLLGRDHPAKVLVLAAMIIVENRMNAVSYASLKAMFLGFKSPP